MAAVTSLSTLDYVATMLGEGVKSPDAIFSKNDKLTYGAIISVYNGHDDAITALNGYGVDELSDMITDARRTTRTWHEFLDALSDDRELAACFKAKAPQ